MSVRAEHEQVLTSFLDAVLGGDLDALARVVHEDVVEVFPQSGERIRGAEAVVEVRRRAPKPPSLIAGPFLTSCRDDLVLAEAKFDYGGRPWWYVDRFEIRGGKIRRMTSYFGEPFETPAWRLPFVTLEPTIDPKRWADDGDGQQVERSTAEHFFQVMVDRDPVIGVTLFHPEARILYPQSGERFGVDGYVAESEHFPGGLPHPRSIEVGGGAVDWVLTPLGVPIRLAGAADTWFAEAFVTYPDGAHLFAVVVATFRAGLVWRERVYYCPPFEPAPWRADLVERFDPIAALG